MTHGSDVTQVTEELLREIVSRIRAAGDPLKVVLFGSHGRGEARIESDVDLLIIEESDLPRYKRSAKYYGATRGMLSARDRDIVVWTPEEIRAWSAVPNHFVTTALREGRVLYERPGMAAPSSTRPDPHARGAPRMNGPADLAREWLEKAMSDLANARRTLDGPGPFDTACFHAQQAIEKCLKAVLGYFGEPILHTHDLKELADRARAVAPGLELHTERFPEITRYAVELRYDVKFWPERETAAEAVATAEQVRDRVLEALPPEARP